MMESILSGQFRTKLTGRWTGLSGQVKFGLKMFLPLFEITSWSDFFGVVWVGSGQRRVVGDSVGVHVDRLVPVWISAPGAQWVLDALGTV